MLQFIIFVILVGDISHCIGSFADLEDVEEVAEIIIASAGKIISVSRPS